MRTCGALWALLCASSGSCNREESLVTDAGASLLASMNTIKTKSEESLLEVLDHFRCGDDDGFQLPTFYFAGVASISTMYGGRLERQPRSRISQCNFFVDEFLSQCFSHTCLADACIDGSR